MPKKQSKKKKNINPWMITSIILLVLLAGFIAYDRSKAFNTFFNNVFGIETGPGKIGLTIINDPFVDNPPYDVEKNMESLQAEIDREFKIEKIDINTDKGDEYVKKHNLKTVPVLIFDKKITETDFYKEAHSFFTEEDGLYIVKLQPYRHLEVPKAGDAQYKGVSPENASIVMIEYGSFTCPYCAIMKPVTYQILDEYDGLVSYVYKHFDRGGSDAFISNAAECAGDQGKFWEMHDYIIDNQAEMREKDALEFLQDGATFIGLEKETFDWCLKENKYSEKIHEQSKEALEFGVKGTPAFFINDIFIEGAVEYERMKNILDTILQ